MNYYQNIKDELIKNEVNKRVKTFSINRSDLETYYKVGKLLKEAGSRYGDEIIKKYSIKLTNELGKGYSETNLKYYRQFYLYVKSHTLCDDLTWSHYRTLLSLSNDNEINYYINQIKIFNLSTRELKSKIKSK